MFVFGKVAVLAIVLGTIEAEDFDAGFDLSYFSDAIHTEITEDDTACLERGSFSFPGATTYGEANQMCRNRDGKLHLYSFDLGCDQSVFRSTFLDALCLKDCSEDEAHGTIQSTIQSDYPTCSVNNVEISMDQRIGLCLDETRQIGSNILMLKEQLNMTHTINNGVITFVDEDISSFSDECMNLNGKIITSSFVETEMKKSTVPGQCKFTEILNTTVAKVENLPRCFSSTCTPQMIRQLLSFPENPSKWYCGRDVYSVDFNTTGDLETPDYSAYPQGKLNSDSTGTEYDDQINGKEEEISSAYRFSNAKLIIALSMILTVFFHI